MSTRARRLLAAAIASLAARAAGPAAETNIALGRPVSASGPTWSGQIPEHLVDGDYTDQSHPLASSGTLGFYFEIDLEEEYGLDRIVLFNRIGCCPERLTNYQVAVYADRNGALGPLRWSAKIRTDGSNSGDGGKDVIRAGLDPGGTFDGRYIRIVNLSNAAYNPQIAEVEVYPAPRPTIAWFGVDHGDITRVGNPALPAAATLSWRVDDYDSLAIAPGIGPVAGPAGSAVVSPPATTTYTLTATNAAGSVAASVTVGVDEPIAPPAITEFMAANRSTLADGDGDAPDWIEIRNPNPFAVNLEGYFLTDEPTRPAQWRFPSAPVPGNGFLVVFASGKDRVDAAGGLHTNFELRTEGEYLALVAPDGVTAVSRFPADYPATRMYPPQKEDLGYGIGSDGAVGFLRPATPGAANGPALPGFVEDTKFSEDRGFYDAPIDVAITTATAGATVRYTTDGTEPAADRGKLYAGPIRISSTTVLRAAAFVPGFVPTNIDTQTYIFLADVIASSVMNRAITQSPVFAPQMRGALTDLPTVSLVTAGTINDTTEVKASVEWIDSAGGPGFQEDAGVKYFGGAFQTFAKKNFRVSFRGAYGEPKLRYPVFAGRDRGVRAVDVFDQIELRGGSQDMVDRGFYMSNLFTDCTMLDMGNLNPHGRFAHLYLNGKYWGMFHLRERWGASMHARYLGGKKEDYESINGNWNVGGWADPGSPYDGDGTAWTRVKSLRGDYEAVRPYLDVRQYIDYMILFLFGDSEDEYRCVGPRGAGTGFKFWLNDADGFLRAAGDRTSMGKPGRMEGDGPGSIFSMLFAQGHPDYMTLLADRIHRHLFNDGALTPAKNRARLIELCAEAERPFIAESARWGYRTPASWAAARDDYLANVLPGRTAALVGQLRTAGLYPSLAAPEFNRHGGAVDPGFLVTMTAPAGTVYCTADGTDPRLPGGALSPAARAVASGARDVQLITSRVYALVPPDGSLGDAWTRPEFDDSAWLTTGRGAGVGYDQESTFLPYIDLTAGDPTGAAGDSVYVRYKFPVDDPASVTGLTLTMRYDDGYVAFLNGTAIASRNAPAAIAWNSSATAGHADAAAVSFEEAAIVGPAPQALLRSGTNVLAVQGLNFPADRSDLLIEPRLTAHIGGGVAGIAVDRTTTVKARAKLGDAWSAADEAVFALDSSALRITEIMYHPPRPPAGSAFGDEDLEFIELENTGDRPLNLTGISISSSVYFVFPDTDASPDRDLQPGEVVLVVKSIEAFRSAYPAGDPYIAGEYGGQLANGGEEIVLRDRLGRTLADFVYSDAWYPPTDGGGYSLEIVDPAGDPESWNEKASWRPSARPGGSPGVAPAIGPGSGLRPGDANGDGGVDLIDVVALLFHLFVSPGKLPCGDGTLDAAGNRALLDIDGNSAVDLTDAVGLLQFLFLAGPAPALGVDCVEIPGCPDKCAR